MVRGGTRRTIGRAIRHMEVLDVVLLVAAALVAVLALVRLMTKRRDQLIERFREEVEREKKAKQAERQRKALEDLGRKSA